MSKKDIINMIQKMAQTAKPRFEVPLSPGQPGYVAPAAPDYSKNIKAMQVALMDLAKAVTAQIKIEDIAPQPGADPNAPATRQQTEAAGRNTFNDFLAKMMRASNVQGVEYDSDPKKTDMKDKQPSEPTRMGVVMDTMSRVGNPKKGERFDDGQWGPRTNAALKNAYALAFAMLKLAKDFKLTKMNAYDDASLQEFSKIPDDPKVLTAQQKDQYAAIFLEHVKAIRKMYDQIKSGIFNKPAYQEYIEGRPYANFEQTKKQLDDNQIASLQQTYKSFPITLKNKDKEIASSITIKDLLDPASFKAWSDGVVKNNGLATPPTVADVVSQIRNYSAAQPVAQKPAPQTTNQPTAKAQG